MDIISHKEERFIEGVDVKSTRLWWTLFLENVGIIFKSSGLLVWFFIFLLALLEVKQYYNIDVIPGYNSSVDDTYGAVKGTVSEFFK
ncbi:MAG: hypothetical protein ACPF9D_11935 [Owenweeksia sp.]